MASIRKRPRKDGTTTWAVLWRDSDTGKQTSRSLATEADAKTLKNFLDANNQSFTLAAQAASKMNSTAPTVKTIIEQHIELLTSISAGTRRSYNNLARIHIYPTLGAIPVDKLTRVDVAQWLNNLPLKSKSKKNIHAILSAGLKTAIANGLTEENVAAGLRVPRDEAKFEPVFLSETQMQIIYEALPQQWVTFVHLLENTGLRFSEATALRWKDINFDGERGIIRVTRAWKRSSSGEVLGAPKTQKSKRSVSLPVWLTRELESARGDAAADDLVFTSSQGSQLTNAHFHRDVWIPLMREVSAELGVKPRIHDLRHTHASRLIAKGVSLPVIQARLGHESITTTVNTYGHLAHDADEQAARLLD